MYYVVMYVSEQLVLMIPFFHSLSGRSFNIGVQQGGPEDVAMIRDDKDVLQVVKEFGPNLKIHVVVTGRASFKTKLNKAFRKCKIIFRKVLHSALFEF